MQLSNSLLKLVYTESSAHLCLIQCTALHIFDLGGRTFYQNKT